MSQIGGLIKKARKAKGWTQIELANKMGISQSMIVFWERGERIPRRKSLEKISRALEIPMDYFDPGPGEEIEDMWLKELEEFSQLTKSLPDYLESIWQSFDGYNEEQRDLAYEIMDHLNGMSFDEMADVLKLCKRIWAERTLDSIDEYEGHILSGKSSKYYIRKLGETSDLIFEDTGGMLDRIDEYINTLGRDKAEEKHKAEIKPDTSFFDDEEPFEEPF